MVITGASGSIGSTTVHALLQQGAIVVGAALPDPALEALARQLHDRPESALIVPIDITRHDDVESLVAQTLAHFGRIDVLINAAGVGASPSFIDTSPAEIERVLAINLLGPALTMRAVIPVMQAQRRGAIINLGSIAGEAAIMGIYSGSKFGLRGLTDSVRREVRRYGISVTLIQPGFVRSAMNPEMRDLPGPEIVTAAILHAIDHPRRVRIVPAGYQLALLLTKICPPLTDLVFSHPRVQDRMHRDSRSTRHAAAPDHAQR